jgi:O-antigen/teichoic acid export membrane protein
MSEPVSIAAESQPVAEGRVARALLTWTVGAIQTAVTMAVGFVATPYLLLFLGAERLGAIRASQQWNGYLPHLHFGLGSSLNVLVMDSINQRDAADTAAVARAGFRLLARQAAIVVMPFAIVMAWMMPVLVPVEAPLRMELRVGAFIGLLMFLSSPFDIFRTVLGCQQRGYLIAFALMVQAVLAAGLAVWLAWAGYGIPGQFATQAAGVLLFSLLMTWFVTRQMPRFWRTRPAEIRSDRLWRLRWPMTLTSASSHLNLMTDYIVVGLAFSPALVTTFSITQRLIVALGGFVTSHVGGVSWAALNEILVHDGNAEFQARVHELLRLIFGFGIIVAGTLAAFNHDFVSLWVGEEFYGGDALTVITAAQMVVVGTSSLFSQVVDTQGDTRHRVAISAPGAVVNLAMSFLFAKWLGLYGVALATVVAYLGTDFWISPYIFCRRYGLRARELITTGTRSLFLSVAWALALWIVVHGPEASRNWFQLASHFSVAMALGFLYSTFAVLTRSDREAWRIRIRALADRHLRAA